MSNVLTVSVSPEGDAAIAPDLIVNTIRTLSMDAVEQAKSGHPGTAMALAPVAYTLWSKFLRFDPRAPLWPNRDRFVLSAGHASMLLYSLLHVAGVQDVGADGAPTGHPAVSLDDIKAFRQLDSRTPGHPEYRHTTGVETTTGPLGAGCSNSVGMAMAERWQAARYNRPGFTLFDHDVYVVCGDGDMMEGVSGEAASLAGHLALSNLCWIYDSNHISIEGDTDIAFSEDVAKRFEAYGWDVLHVADANDMMALGEALATFRRRREKPTLIIVTSVIGWGSSKAGSEKAHGEPLGAAAIASARQTYGWPDEPFHVPAGAREAFHGDMAGRAGPLREAWEKLLADYASAEPALAAELEHLFAGTLPAGWEAALPSFEPDVKGVASRDAGGKALNAAAAAIPFLVGGSADLAPSTKTLIKDQGSFQPGSPAGSNLHFGVREHAMGGIVNGLALSGLRAFGATFLVFSDYMRAPIRLAALMRIPSIFVFTHDSIGVGEDGPTHQPIEHLASLRAIPDLDTIRPGDANETAWAWRAALDQTRTPTAIILSRQALPTLDRDRYGSAEGLLRGAYVLADSEDAQIILIATGSELSLVVDAHEQLAQRGIRSRVVSMPSWHRFEQENQAYRDAVLPPAIRRRLAVEQAGEMGWHRWIGDGGRIVGMNRFGASAPLPELQKRFGFTVEAIVAQAEAMLGEDA